MAGRIHDRFGIACSQRTARRIAHEREFSVRKSRPIPYNGATPKEQAAFIKKAKNTVTRWNKKGRMVPAIDAATIRDSPVSRIGLRRRDGKDTIPVNHSRKSLHIIGALGDGILDIRPHGDLKTDSYVDLIEYACRRHKKIGIMADNAGALTGNTMKDYVYGTDGTVEILHILTPHTATKPHRDRVARDKGLP